MTIIKSILTRHAPDYILHHKQHRWLNERIAGQLPGNHFMVTFTVPEALRNFMSYSQ